jgi:AraC-like DNA-binding protein
VIFELYKPSFPLGQFIESFIYYRDYNPNHTVERFLPDGHVNIVIDLTDYPKYIYDNDTLKEIQACKNVWFSGIRNKYITIPSGKESEMFVINFHRGMSYPFVQMPLYTLTDSVVDGELVLTSEILDMRDMILEAATVPNKFSTAEQFLIQKFSRRLEVNPFIDFAVRAITSSPSQYSIEYIAGKVGYSQKHLIELFKKNVGLTPKHFLKVMRFQKAIQEISQTSHINWASIALESGYYDQAHFINDFKIFSGFTPKEYHIKHSLFQNYVAID